jgi:hypothetical protein
MTDRPGPNTPASDRILQQTEAVQLSRLSSILNGLEGGACAMRRHVQEAMAAVRTGTYKVDALQLSRCIVGEALRPA